MAIKEKTTYHVCDRCGAGMSFYDTYREALRVAESEGWVGDKEDLCLDCRTVDDPREDA